MQGSRTNSNRPPASASQRAGLAEEHHAQGYAFRKQGNFAAAIEEYSQAIRLEPSHFKALFNRGFSWDKARCVTMLSKAMFGLSTACSVKLLNCKKRLDLIHLS